MKIRSAILTGVAGLMLSAGLGTAVEAQSVYRDRYSMGRRGSNESQARQMVRQAYRDILRREPDASGLRQYTDALLNRGWSNADLRRSLMESPEYAQRFGRARSWGGYR